MNIINEEWRPVKGFEGLYEVSNLGRIKSISSSHGRKKPRENIKKACPSNRGYLRVSLYHNNKTYRKSVHRLVAEAFLPPCPGADKEYHVDHINDDITDNRACNLQWLTVRENVYIKPKKNGHKFHGEGNPAAKLTEKEALEIKKSSDSVRLLAARYKISRTVVYDIKNNKIWKHLSIE